MASRQERLDVLRQTLQELPRAVAGLGREKGPGRPGDWSPLEVLGHLADAEQVYGVRLRLIVTGDSPRLEPYDQEVWAARFAGLETVATALERWRVLREATLRLMDTLSDAEWARTGLHPERGEESAEDQLRLLAEHDRGHLDQLTALAAEL